MGRVVLTPPPYWNAPFNTGDSLELGSRPRDVISAINTMSAEQYGFGNQLYNWRADFAMTTRNARVAFMGDSTIKGVDETSSPYNAQYGNAMPAQLAKLIRSVGTPSGANNMFGLSGTTLADYLLRDGRVAVSGATALGSVQVQGGNSISFPGATSTLAFTPSDPVTKADIYWRDNTAGRNFNWNVDGGANTLISSSGVLQFAKTTVSLGTVGAHTVNLSWVLGNVDIFGIDCYDDTAARKEVSCWNWGISGGTTAQMIANIGTPNGGRLQQLASFPPDLVIGELGIVNDWRNSVTPDVSYANMTTLVLAVKATGSDFLFITPPYDGGVAGFTANQEAYIGKMRQVASEQNVGLIDWRATLGSYGISIAAGLIGDNVHPTLRGYVDEARLIQRAIF